MESAKLSSKNQVVIPRQTRVVLGVGAGDEILFVFRRGIVYLLPKSRSWVNALKGTARGGSRYPRHYLKKERKSW